MIQFCNTKSKTLLSHVVPFLEQKLQLEYQIISKLSPSPSSIGAELALFSADPTHHPHPPKKVFSQLQLTKYIYLSIIGYNNGIPLILKLVPNDEE